MRRDLGAGNILYTDTFFPYSINKNEKFMHRTLIGIGGNLGDVKRRFKKLFLWLKRSPYVQVIRTSNILKNPPFGFIEQASFFNALIELSTNLSPKKLLHYLLSIEKRFGRVRSFKNAPRTLDLDIIFYDSINYKDDKLTIPHPAWQERESVIIPLSHMPKQYKYGSFTREPYAKEPFFSFDRKGMS